MLKLMSEQLKLVAVALLMLEDAYHRLPKPLVVYNYLHSLQSLQSHHGEVKPTVATSPVYPWLLRTAWYFWAD